MNKNNDAKRIAENTVDAYSRGRYTDAGWLGVIKALLAAGANEAEARWVLESKHMRWAGDAASRNHSVTAADFLAYANSPHVGNVENLVLAACYELGKNAPKPAAGADLAGACEGEEIAELIDLARMVNNGVTGPRLQQIAGSLLARIEARAK